MYQTTWRPTVTSRSIFKTVRLSQPSHSNQNLVDEYLRWKKTSTRTAAKSYAIWVRRFQKFVNKPPEELVLDDWTLFFESLDKSYAQSNVSYGMMVISNYLRFWHQSGRLSRLPISLIRGRQAEVKSHHAVTDEEYALLLSYLLKRGEKALRDQLILCLLHDTGVRISELLNLEIGDVIGGDCEAVIKTAKTTTFRRIFWGELSEGLLQRYLVVRMQTDDESEWLFPSRRKGYDGPLQARSVQRMLRGLCEEAGISSKICPHSFRHAFIHKHALAGVPDSIIATLVGHSTPHTVSHYTKLSRKEFEDVARKRLRLEST